MFASILINTNAKELNRVFDYVVPKEELKRRLENRIDKPGPDEVKLRLNRFDYEESKIGLYDYVLKNNYLEKTVQIIITII